MARSHRGGVGAVIEVAPTAWGSHGEAVGTAPWGGPIAVAGAVPGERVRVQVVGRGAHRAAGEVVEVLAPSPDRVTPPCSLAGPCGGCPVMHLAYPAQLALKAATVREALGAYWGGEVAVTPSPSLLGWRRRASFVFGGRAGALVLGAWRAGTHALLDVRGCPVTDGALLTARDRILAAMNAQGLPPWDEATGEGVLRHLVLQADGEGAVLAVLVAGRDTRPRPPAGGDARWGAPWTPHIPWERIGAGLLSPGPGGIVSVALNLQPSPGNAILGPVTRHLAGVEALEVRLGGVTLRLPAGAFSQVNQGAASLLYERVADRAGAGPQLLDLYGGAGALALRLAPGFARVFSVESHPGAAAAGRAAAAAAGLDPARWRCGDVAAELEAIPRDPQEVIVVNPPRRGLGQLVARALADRAPARMLYVSCGPRGLGEDLRFLGETLAIAAVDAFDLFPHTPHVETLVTLERR